MAFPTQMMRKVTNVVVYWKKKGARKKNGYRAISS